jgi:ribosomal protein S20
MTNKSVNSQIKTIEKATEKAAKTKESARNFLSQAGIIRPHAPSPKAKK